MEAVKANLFIVGAAKSGTTSIYDLLSVHEDINMAPIKEPHFFCKDINNNQFSKSYEDSIYLDEIEYFNKEVLESKHIAHIKDEDNYNKLFSEGYIYNGEASTGYLFSEKAANEIYNYNSNSKIIIILRDPVMRAISHWKMGVNIGAVDQNKDPVNSIVEDYNKSGGWGEKHTYVEIGLYYEQVKRYLKLFPRENVLILFFEELNEESLSDKVFGFLNLECCEKLKVNVSNQSLKPRNKFVSSMIRNQRVKTFIRSVIPKSIISSVKNIIFVKSDFNIDYIKAKKSLLPYFIADIEKLEKLLSLKLCSWKVDE